MLICAPSAVMPSFALRAAMLLPRIWAVIRSLMASPAASSRALLMRMPVDSRCRVVASVKPDGPDRTFSCFRHAG